MDSTTDESSADFENQLNSEQTSKTNTEMHAEASIDAKATATWGWGSADVEAKASGGMSKSREEFAKSASNAVAKHSNKQSAKRDVKVDVGIKVEEEKTESNTINREIENINVSRTLNFIFKQSFCFNQRRSKINISC